MERELRVEQRAARRAHSDRIVSQEEETEIGWVPPGHDRCSPSSPALSGGEPGPPVTGPYRLGSVGFCADLYRVDGCGRQPIPFERGEAAPRAH